MIVSFKPLVLSITTEDVMNCISKDINRYLLFLDKELKNKEITKEEYQKELALINNIKNDYSNNLTNEFLTILHNTNIIICDNEQGKTFLARIINSLMKGKEFTL